MLSLKFFAVPESYTNGYMPPPLSQHPIAPNATAAQIAHAHGYGNPFIMPTGPSPSHQSNLRTSSIPTSVIQAAVNAATSSSSRDDLYLLELGYQQRVNKKKMKRVKSESGTPCTGPKRKSREGKDVLSEASLSHYLGNDRVYQFEERGFVSGNIVSELSIILS